MLKFLPASVSAGVMLVACLVFVQSWAGHVQAAGPEFEVANITESPQPSPELFRSGKLRLGMTVTGGRVDIGGMPLTTLLQQAFQVKQFQIVAPEWAQQSRWDILAKLPDGASQNQIPDMLQALLAERFKLTTHRDKKELPVYALVVGKGGLKMKESVPDPNDTAETPANGGLNAGFGIFGGFGGAAVQGGPGRGPDGGAGRGPDGGRGRGGFDQGGGSATLTSPQFGTMKISGAPQDGKLHLEASKVGMAGLADLLTGMTDKPVLDMTGLPGNYQVALDVSIQELIGGMARTNGFAFGRGGGGGFDGGGGGRGGGQFQVQTDGASDPTGAAVFASVEKLGLKLEARKAPVETVVVDHLEKTPTDN